MAEAKLSNWKKPGKSWFFGIGINQYLEFTDLANAVRDVEGIQDLLQNEYDLNSDCVFTLFNEQATRDSIIDTLDHLGSNIQADDKLIIYYSGHGLVNRKTDIGYWIPHEGKKGSSSNYIMNSTIREYINGINAKHILLISDACFSGSIFMKGDFRSSTAAEELSDLTSRWAICSGRDNEEVYDGEPGTHSPFAQSIMNILGNSKAPYLTIGRVVNHVIEETAANYEQLPEGRPMFGVGHGGGQYVFRKKSSLVDMDAPNAEYAGVTRSAATAPLQAPPRPKPKPEKKLSDESVAELRTMVAQAKIKEALKKLESETEDFAPDIKNQIAAIQAKFSKLQRESRMGLMSQDDMTRNNNAIVYEILGLLS